MEGRLTTSGGGQAGPRHYNHFLCVANLDVPGDSREGALGEPERSGVLVNQAGVLVAHLSSRWLLPRARPFLLMASFSLATYFGGDVRTERRGLGIAVRLVKQIEARR